MSIRRVSDLPSLQDGEENLGASFLEVSYLSSPQKYVSVKVPVMDVAKLAIDESNVDPNISGNVLINYSDDEG